jgi:ligand-binding sensor domain-containing protein/DNA-binding CsgD family transcriptional regulator
MNPKRFHILFILIVVIRIAVSGQSLNKPVVVNYDKSIYSAENQNWSIAEDANGIIYIGNNQGLLEFDGSNWTLHRMPDQMVVRSVAIGHDSLIYVGSFEEFGYWKRDLAGLLHYTSLSDSLDPDYFHNDEIWRIIPHHNNIYFQSFPTIFIYDGEKIHTIRPGFSFVLLSRARDRLFIHGVDRGLYELKDTTLAFIPGSEILADDEVKVVLPLIDNRYLIGASAGGMYIYDRNSFKPWEVPANELISRSEINNGITSDNLIVLGTIVNGIFILDQSGDLLINLNSSNYLQNNTVLALCLDHHGNIWAGLDRGIDFIRLDNEIDIYTDPTGKTGSVFAAALRDQILWIGTNQGLFRYQYDPQLGYSNPVMIEGSQGQVWNLSDIDGDLLCGHTNGTYSVRNGQLVKISDINGGLNLRKIASDDQELLLQSTYSVFVIYKTGATGWKYSHYINGFMEPVRHFEIDHLGYVWAAHSRKGLFRIRLNKDLTLVQHIKYYGKNNGLPTDRNLSVSKIENRIIVTTGYGIYTYDDLNDTIIPYNLLNQKTGEFSKSTRIIPVSGNKYWFTMDNQAALFRIEEDNIEKIFSYDFLRTGNYLGFNSAGTIPLKDSLYLFCLDNGFAIMDETDIDPPDDTVGVAFRKIRAETHAGKTKYLRLQPGDQKIELAHSFRTLEFTFSSTDNSGFPEFSTKLEGFDDQWSHWNSESVASYSRLPAENYNFLVKTKNIRGTESMVLSYPFRIQPPWYISTISLIIYGVLIISGLILLRLIFLKRLKKHKIKLEKEETEKRKKEQLLAEQELIRLKNEKLQSEVEYKNIQLADYTMNMIKKNELLIRLKDEIQRQKEEIEDLYPVHHHDKLLKLIDRNISSEDDWKVFENHFDQAHENFFKKLKEEYPALTPSDLKLCAYLRMNLTSKEIAPLLNITLRGVEVRRYRLRKRLNMNTEENLINFLLSY